MSDDTAVRDLARMLVKELLADPQFWGGVREIVLSVYATTDKLSREGYVRSLVRACKERGATLRVNKAGGLIVQNGGRLTKDLQSALKTYRTDLIEVLGFRRAKPSANGT